LAVYPSEKKAFSTASTLELSGGEAVRLERLVRQQHTALPYASTITLL